MAKKNEPTKSEAELLSGLAEDYIGCTFDDVKDEIMWFRTHHKFTWGQIGDKIFPQLADGDKRVRAIAGNLPRRLACFTDGLVGGFAGSYQTFRENSGPRENRA